MSQQINYDALTITKEEIMSFIKNNNSQILIPLTTELQIRAFGIKTFKVFDEDVTDPINVKRLNNWITSLDSGKYQPLRGLLANENNDKHCCLGVYARVNGELCKLRKDNYTNMYFTPNGISIKDEDGEYVPDNPANLTLGETSYVLSGHLQNLLMSFNDHETTKDYKLVSKFLKEIVLPKVYSLECNKN